MSLRPGFEFVSQYTNIDGSPLWIWSCAPSVYNALKGPFTNAGQDYWETSNIRRFNIQASSNERVRMRALMPRKLAWPALMLSP